MSDVYTISQEHLKSIETNFPQVALSIMSTDSSRSGFVVLIDCGKEQDNTWQRSMLRLCMHCGLFVSIWVWAFW